MLHTPTLTTPDTTQQKLDASFGVALQRLAQRHPRQVNILQPVEPDGTDAAPGEPAPMPAPFKPGDEIFQVTTYLKRGTVIEARLYGYQVRTENGDEFFADALTKQQAYDECLECLEYFTRKANQLLAEIEADEE